MSISAGVLSSDSRIVARCTEVHATESGSCTVLSSPLRWRLFRCTWLHDAVRVVDADQIHTLAHVDHDEQQALWACVDGAQRRPEDPS